MNKILSLLIVLLFVWSCKDHDEVPAQTLHGKWLLIEEKIGTGPAGVWLPAKNPITLELNADSTLTTTVRMECTGTYSVKGDRIDYKAECSGQPAEWSDKFKIDTYLYLTPAVSVCDEGCEYKYKRL